MSKLKDIMFNTKKLCGVYKMYFDKNNIEYIGSSGDIYQRVKNHVYSLRNRAFDNIFLQEMFDRLGVECLNFEIIELCETDALLDREYFYIKNHKGRLFNIKRSKDKAPDYGFYCCVCGGRLESKFRDKIINSCRSAVKNYNIENNYSNIKILHPCRSVDFRGMCPDCMFEKMCDDNYPYIKTCKDCGFLYIDVNNSNICSFCNNTKEGFENRRLEREEFLRSFKHNKNPHVSNEDLKEYIKAWRFYVE